MPQFSETNALLQASLFELGLNSDVPETLSQFYERAMGYKFRRFPELMIGVARNRRLAIVQGPSKSLAYAAFAVPDNSEVERLSARLCAAGVAFATVEKEGMDSGAIRFADPDGNQIIFGVAREAPFQSDDITSMRPARLQHVVFATAKLDELLSFYCDVVGFTLSDRVLDGEGGVRTVFVRCSDEHHSLAIFATRESRLDHFCHEAGDWDLIRDWADHFAQLRIPLKWGPGRHGPGNNLFIFVHDPDGNWVEISAELENVKSDRAVGDWPHAEYTLNSWGIGMLRS